MVSRREATAASTTGVRGHGSTPRGTTHATATSTDSGNDGGSGSHDGSGPGTGGGTDEAENRLRWVGALTAIATAAPLFLRLAEEPATLARPRYALWLLALVAFVGLFWWPGEENGGELGECRTGRGESVQVAVHALLALGLIHLVPLPLFAVYLVIVAARLGDLLRPPWAVACVVGLTLLAAPAIVDAEGWTNALILLASFLGFQLFAVYSSHIAGAERRGRRELAVVNQELRRTREQLTETTREAERLRISRDLHDTLGHHLTALSLNLEAARHAETEAAGLHVETAQRVARRLLGDVRQVVSRMRRDEEGDPMDGRRERAGPGVESPGSEHPGRAGFDSEDLVAALAELGTSIHRPRLHIRVAPALGSVANPALHRTLLDCAREVVTNAARHSGAENLWLDVERREKGVILTGRDDGSGSPPDRPIGHGLRGMRERVENRGGTLEVDPRPGQGFEVRAWLPTTSPADHR